MLLMLPPLLVFSPTTCRSEDSPPLLGVFTNNMSAGILKFEALIADS
jgi:hypothetical protein